MRTISTLLAVSGAFMCAACVTDGGQLAGKDPEVTRAVASQFSDAPVMLKVAECESGLRQYDRHGAVVHGKLHRPDSGVFQINSSVHLATARRLGLDIDTTEGNVAFARHLYDTQGTTPWKSSRPCWGRYRTAHQ